MDPELLSRVQFALTASFHFIFPPISMGLGVMLVAMGIVYVRTKYSKWRQLSFFWVKIYGIVFAMGVATGIVQEFEFGMNWADYSRFVGNVFGSLLAAEGVFAFFLEGGFLGLMLFGGNRLGPKLWLFSIFMVVFGAHFSAVWILMANSWMQTPAGYTIAETPAPARAVMTDFWTVINTPSFIPRLMHVFAASGTAGAALMASVSAWYVLRKKNVDLAKDNLKLALPFFALYAFTNLFLFGPNMAIEVTNNQPLKLASMEGLWQSTSCAPMYLLGWVDVATQTTSGLQHPVPAELPGVPGRARHGRGHRLLRARRAAASQPLVPGLSRDDQPGARSWPCIAFLAGVWYLWKRRMYRSRFVLWLLVLSVVLAEIAIIAGWWTAEVGRQPWVVYNVLLTQDGVSPTLSGEDVAVSLGSFIGLYGLLFLLFIYLLNRKIQAGPEPLEAVETVAVSSLPDTFREVFRKRPHSAGPPPPEDSHAVDGASRGCGRPQVHRRRRESIRETPAACDEGGQVMSLADIWYALFILIVAGYLILDGFDLGVGILHLPVARTDLERRTFLASIGPVWDGNAVWLVLTGGVLFACFPLAYASLFSGFYLAFMLVLVCLILRAVAIEFRSKEPGRRWRSGWDMVFGLASLGIALLLGSRVRQYRPGHAHRQCRQHERQLRRPAQPVRAPVRRHDRGHVRVARASVPAAEDRATPCTTASGRWCPG